MILQSLCIKEVAMKFKDHFPLTELKRLERVEKDADRARRLRIIILGIEGWTAPAIAMAVGLSRRICQRWVRRYNELGLEGLGDRRGRQPSSPLSPEQETVVRQRIEAGPKPADEVCTLRGKDIQRILAEEFNVCRSLAGVYHLLHRLGYSYLRPRPRHRKADFAKMEAFRQAWPELLRTIAKEHPQQRLRVYFQDESRFGQQGTLTNVWARKGTRPTVVRQTEYKYLWVLGAVCPETGHAEGLLSPQLNTSIINIFLKQFSATIPPDEHVVMVWDGAGFHISKALCVPDNITLVPLPAYSPELNPIENLWHYLKSHYWSNRAYADYEELEQAAMDAWCKAVLDEDLIKSVCAAPYLESATSS
jgi:transposase